MATLVQGQPSEPVVKTAVPGPKSIALKAKLQTMQVGSW